MQSAEALNLVLIFNQLLLPPADCLIRIKDLLNQDVVIRVTLVEAEFHCIPVPAQYLNELLDLIIWFRPVNMQYFHLLFVTHAILPY